MYFELYWRGYRFRTWKAPRFRIWLCKPVIGFKDKTSLYFIFMILTRGQKEVQWSSKSEPYQWGLANSTRIDCQSTVDSNIGLQILCLTLMLMRGFFRKSLLTCILYFTAKVILRRLYHCCIPMHTGLCQMTFSAWNLQNALPVKLHSWSVEGFFEGSFVHTCLGALNCSTLVSPKGCVSP